MATLHDDDEMSPELFKKELDKARQHGPAAVEEVLKIIKSQKDDMEMLAGDLATDDYHRDLHDVGSDAKEATRLKAQQLAENLTNYQNWAEDDLIELRKADGSTGFVDRVLGLFKSN